MKILIAYYSKTGNTERVALDLARRLGADVEKIIDKKDRGGLWNWFIAGRDAMQKRLTEIGPPRKDPAEYDLVLLGMPVWSWNLVPAMRSYVAAKKGSIRDYCFFITSGNTDAVKIAPFFAEAMGRGPKAMVGLSEPELKDDFVVKGKLDAFQADALKPRA